MSVGGIRGIQPIIYETLEALGLRRLDESISRGDAAVDLPFPVSDLTSAYLQGRCITRFKKGQVYGVPGAFTGLSFGKGPILLRLYDKWAEIREKRAENKLAILRETRHAFAEDGQHVTRCEWQLRGEQLKKWDIRTLDDWINKIGGVLEYLMTDHTRFVDAERVDKTHTSRYKPSAQWCQAINAYRDVYSGGRAPVKLRPVEYFGGTIGALLKQALGCICTALAMDRHLDGEVYEDDDVYDRDRWWNAVQGLVTREAGDIDVPARVLDKLCYLAATARSRSPYFAAGPRKGFETG